MTKTEMLGIRVTPEEMGAMGQKAKDGGFRNLSKWARKVLLTALNPPITIQEQPPSIQKLPEGTTNEIPLPIRLPYVESPIILTTPEKFQISKAQNPDSWGGAKCPKCGGPFRDPEEMLSHKCKRVKPQVQQPSWAEEFAKMDTMEADEAMGRFRDLVDGRKIPKGFARLKRSEQIEILEKEIPL